MRRRTIRNSCRPVLLVCKPSDLLVFYRDTVLVSDMPGLDPAKAAAIDLVEAAYDLQPDVDQWLERLLDVGIAVTGQELGASGLLYRRPPDGGDIEVQTWRAVGTSVDIERLSRKALREAPKAAQRVVLAPGVATTVSELPYGQDAMKTWGQLVGVAQDCLVMNAVDPDGQGASIVLFLPKPTKLSPEARQRFQMLGAHLSAGYRIRRAVASADIISHEADRLPQGAEALIDPRSFRVTDAEGHAKTQGAIEHLHQAAVRVDRARGRLRKQDPREALELWWGLVHGRWSFVDWFDSDDRRFVLAIPNPPCVGDPRNLTGREIQVVTYAALGESGKLIGYRIGMSESTVSRALDSAMHKLRVKTQAQLVEKMRGLPKLES